MIKIGARLESLVKYIYTEDRVIDVGCDHAKLDIYLVQTGILDKVYVCDVNPNALQNGINNIEKYNLSRNIIPILSYGIEKISGFDINTVLISGMGSANIIGILSSPNLNRVYKLVLQSNNNHYELRKFLVHRGFTIVAEDIVKDGKKTYINIVALRMDRPKTYTEMEYEFGPRLIQMKENLEYFKELKDSYEDILFASGNDELREKIKWLDSIIESLESE